MGGGTIYGFYEKLSPDEKLTWSEINKMLPYGWRIVSSSCGADGISYAAEKTAHSLCFLNQLDAINNLIEQINSGPHDVL